MEKVICKPCVYFLYRDNDLVYVGKTANIYLRIGQHIIEGQKKFDSFEYFFTEDADCLEAILIKILKPIYNKLGK